MAFAGKKFGYYWDIIKIPTLILVLFSFANLVLAIYSFSAYLSINSGGTGLIVAVIVFAFVGYLCAKDCKGTGKQCAWAGALTGVIAGFCSAVFGFLTLTFVPEVSGNAVQTLVARGMSAAAASSMLEFSAYLGFVTGPLFNGLLGAGIAALTGFLACKFK